MVERAPDRLAIRPDWGPLVIGVGNRHRHDDGVGLEVVRLVRPRLSNPGRAVEFSAEGTGLLDLWEDEGEVVVVDAVRSGAPAGTIHRLDAIGPAPFRSDAISSTHGLSVGEAVRLGRSLGCLPRRLVIYGVEGSDFSPGVGLSEPVRQAAARAVESIAREWLSRDSSPTHSGREADRA
jgi:hydrogenase maturation protease